MPKSVFIRAGVRAIAAAVLVTGLAGCGPVGEHPALSPPPVAESAPPAEIQPPGVPPEPAAVPEPLQVSFTGLLATLPAGAAGVAVFGGGRGLSFGDWAGGAAWSTIKVPLSIAALRVDAAVASPLVTRAITASDNDAAMGLWRLLGDPDAAGRQVQQVLADGGSAATVVQTQQVYPPYSPFGQTRWTQTDAARFAFGLPCVATAEPVLTQMRNISGGQRWGLAAADTPSKGGWGPDVSGGYLVRQLALLFTGTGMVGVALAAKPADGSFDTAVSVLNALGDWVRQHRDELPGGHCHAAPG